MRELEGRVERLTGLLGNLLDDDDRHARLTDLAERTGAALRAWRPGPSRWASPSHASRRR
jgi:hypothetical protein